MTGGDFPPLRSEQTGGGSPSSSHGGFRVPLARSSSTGGRASGSGCRVPPSADGVHSEPRVSAPSEVPIIPDPASVPVTAESEGTSAPS